MLESSLGLNTATRTVTSAAGTITSTTTRFPRGSAAGGSSSSGNQGVSTGTAAGIGAGVGVPLLLTTICATLLYLMKRRKRRNRENTSHTTVTDHASAYYAPKDTHGCQQLGYSNGQQGHELGAIHPQELDSSQQRPELMSRNARK